MLLLFSFLQLLLEHQFVPQMTLEQWSLLHASNIIS